AYYQYLYNVPVQDTPTAISVLNSGASFYQWRFHSLVNQGTGRNYGIELTIEKFFSKHYYFLVTASLFESKYTTKQNIERNTLFANNYVLNALAGYEFKIGKKGIFSIDLRGVFAGGLRYLPIDEVLSAQENTVIYNFDSAYDKRTAPYFRTDLRLSFKTIGKKVTQEWALDLQNLSNNKNVYALNWDNVNNRVYQTYQQGFYPMFLYRLNF
ncbi:MAG TPA: TonB-dependent receptor, partial [Bacteroidales bacterium]|nr:TonB-dependent receptor [Bacteroidales bacterium]